MLVLEPDGEIRELLRRVLVRLGHEPLAPAQVPQDPLPKLDAVILEPSWAPALELAIKLRTGDDRLPFVLVTLELPGAENRRLRPRRRLLKPFGLNQLEEAIRAVLPAPSSP